MKKFIAFLLVVVLSFSLVACGNSGGSEETVYDKIEDSVSASINVRIMLSYDTQGVPNITYYIKEINENTYTVSGKVTVKDKYGDSYTGNYDATATYNSAEDDFDIDLDLGTLYKN